jgi:hypothetical protein
MKQLQTYTETLKVCRHKRRFTSWPLQRCCSPKCKMASKQQTAECVIWFHESKSTTTVRHRFQTFHGETTFEGVSHTPVWKLCDERQHCQGVGRCRNGTAHMGSISVSPRHFPRCSWRAHVNFERLYTCLKLFHCCNCFDSSNIASRNSV